MGTEYVTPLEAAQRLRVDDYAVKRWINSDT
jgi:hypothetical protein